MLPAALQAGVAAYVEQFADHVDENERRLVVVRKTGKSTTPKRGCTDMLACARSDFPSHSSTAYASTSTSTSGSNR